MTDDHPTPKERDLALWERAFPPAAAADVQAAANSLGSAAHKPLGSFTAVVTGQPVKIAYRIYNALPSDEIRSQLTTRQHRILDCMLTRHHDGSVREAAASRAISSDEIWVAPFIVYLIGEYVVEIVASISSELTADDSRLSMYRDFADANQDLMTLVRERAISYWDCYYRAKWASFDDYPARSLLDRLQKQTPATTLDADE